MSRRNKFKELSGFSTNTEKTLRVADLYTAPLPKRAKNSPKQANESLAILGNSEKSTRRSKLPGFKGILSYQVN